MGLAGIRQSQKALKVNDFVLNNLLMEGPRFQDWRATHVKLDDVKRRIRIYLVRREASAQDRQTIERAALREFLVQYSTHPDVTNRIDSVRDFLEYLDEIQKELLDTDHDVVENPAKAQMGDKLPGDLLVKKRLGSGACSVVLLVEKNNQKLVLKVASSPEHNDRLRGEGEVLQKLHRHQHIVEHLDTVEIGDHVCLLMRRAGTETLGDRLRKEGRLHVDLLQRFGEDLLQVVVQRLKEATPNTQIAELGLGTSATGALDRANVLTVRDLLSFSGYRVTRLPGIANKTRRYIAEATFIQALRDEADRASAQWETVLKADAVPGNDDWSRLMVLVRRAVPRVEATVMAAEKTVLMIFPGLLARYEQMDLLARVREKIGRPDGVPGLWMLIPSDAQSSLPVMDGKAVPVIGPAEWARIPEKWIRNEHRSNGNGESGK